MDDVGLKWMRGVMRNEERRSGKLTYWGSYNEV